MRGREGYPGEPGKPSVGATGGEGGRGGAGGEGDPHGAGGLGGEGGKGGSGDAFDDLHLALNNLSSIDQRFQKIEDELETVRMEHLATLEILRKVQLRLTEVE